MSVAAFFTILRWKAERKESALPGERFVGANPGVVAVWATTRHLTLTGVITRFLPGGYVKGSFVTYGFGFYSSSVTYRC